MSGKHSNIDFRLAHKLGGMALRAAFFEAYRCPYCSWPVYVHYTFGSAAVPTLFLPLCDCPAPPDLEIEIPGEENLPLEREAVVNVIAALRKLLRHHREGDEDAANQGLAERVQDAGIHGDGEAG